MSARGPRVAHLAARFFSSLRVRPLDEATITSVMSALEPGEQRVWNAMPLTDQAESVAVARDLRAALAGTPAADDGCWPAVALLHDAGKQLSGFGTIGRACVTAIAYVVGAARMRAWADTPPGSMRARMGRYLAHDDLGAALLREAGARPEVAAWAAAHHRPECWAATGIPGAVCRALAAADGEPVRDAGRG